MGLIVNEQIEKLPEILDRPPRSFLAEFFDIAEAIIVAIVASVLILTLVFRTGYVDGSSMEDTMHENDRYIVSGLFYTPKQGDIIVFQPNIPNEEKKLWVKRVIATEGQTVYIDPVEHTVYVDNVLLNEEYISQPTVPGMTENPIIVPEGYIFILGDNRGVSRDSRDASVGCMDTRRIVGRVLFRFYPFNKIGSIK